jgi:Lar family restriction alleviation protein
MIETCEHCKSQIIKPCPFCGGIAYIKSYETLINKEIRFNAVCDNCFPFGVLPEKTYKEALEKWNKRS